MRRQHGGTRLLSEDPGLGTSLSSEQREAAAGLMVPEIRLPVGPWHPEEVPLSRRSRIGVVVLDGVLVHDVVVSGWQSAELLGPGDVVQPWGLRDSEPLVPVELGWAALEPVRLAVLHPGRLAATSAWPVLLEAIVGRLTERGQRLAVHRAIAQLPRVELRILAMLWHLADRFGRIGTDGVLVPLGLSHEALGHLVGARRPTVSLALRELAAAGHVGRRADGAWQLGRDAPHELDADAIPPARAPRRQAVSPTDPLEGLAQRLRARAGEIARRRSVETDTLSAHLDRLQALRERSERLRGESAALRRELDARRNG